MGLFRSKSETYPAATIAADIERGLIARYLARILERGDLPLRGLLGVLRWINERRDFMSLPVPDELSNLLTNFYSGQFTYADLDQLYRRDRETLIATLRQIAEPTPRPEPLATNIEFLVRELGLPPAALKIVGLVACAARYDQVQYLCDTLASLSGSITRNVAMLVGEPARSIESLISPAGELAACGLLQLREDSNHINGRFGVPWRIDACLDRAFPDFPSLRAALLGDPLEASLNLSDYDHVAEDCDLIKRLIEGASAEGARGINILLFGPPGSGKTELAKLAAAAAGVSLYAAGEEQYAGRETSRTERLSDLAFFQRLLGGGQGTAILFDEFEDVAWQLINRGGSKLYLNRLLETNPVPVIWTSNNIFEIDAAVLRRMSLIVELKVPPVRQRAVILRRLANRYEVPLEDHEVQELARRLPATPAVLENALRAAKLSGGGKDALERAASGIIRALSGGGARPAVSVTDFDPALTCASMDLIALTKLIVQSSNLAFSLCLSGPPGTGKSAFARYLARRLGLEVLQKRASDLLAPYIGQSEKNIAEAFESAREAQAMLIFDEADSLLFDRREAVRSWEVTQVNEMLTWMEHHPLPFCCTTNMMERFDSASLRRFTFHILFHYLDAKALARAYAIFFQMTEVPPHGLAFTNLTPGDFAQGRRQADMLGIAEDPDRVVALIAEISRKKPGSPRASIGFVREPQS
ncbi:ATP-binding protein [Methyloceanibacter sp.]|uniref:AAA family ATPase n=1 Tax=Methyloceanibacter sp. TaxID=1965321 RepID=UPI002D36952F|nr:ATP-binding protein [Methyloceanibacter sp.]HZP08588.1 ATP-binding protein [Methyloceanibacter sp.]